MENFIEKIQYGFRNIFDVFFRTILYNVLIGFGEGRLLGGTGGGGFLLFYVQPEKQSAVREAMKDLMYIPFRFEDGGTRVIHYSPEEFELRG